MGDNENVPEGLPADPPADQGAPDQVASDEIVSDAPAEPAIPGARQAGEQATEETPTPTPVEQQPDQPVLQDRRRPRS